eukprot:618217-Prymnesium_polylepis.1
MAHASWDTTETSRWCDREMNATPHTCRSKQRNGLCAHRITFRAATACSTPQSPLQVPPSAAS